jgi:hypothetical protein
MHVVAVVASMTTRILTSMEVALFEGVVWVDALQQVTEVDLLRS